MKLNRPILTDISAKYLMAVTAVFVKTLHTAVKIINLKDYVSNSI